MTNKQKSVNISPKGQVKVLIEYQTENFGKCYDFRCRTHNSFMMKPHIHDFCELAFTKKGSQIICIDQKIYSIPENHAALILPNQIHSYSDKEKSEMYCAVFSKDFISLLFSVLGNKIFLNPIADFTKYKMFFSLLEEAKTNELLKIGGALTLICDVFLKSCDLINKEKSFDSVYYYLIQYVAENFKRNITLKQISEELGYNEKYLSTSVNALTGMNFRSFLASYRIEFAKQRLLSDNALITDIAFECEFGSINSFNRIFKEFIGITPTQYRYHYK